MTLVVDVASDGVRAPLGAARVRDIARLVLRDGRVREALVSIAFLPARAMARLDRAHLHHDGATDVIAFALRGPIGTTGAVLGDVYIAPDVARRNAKQHGVGVREEVARLVVHGTLHVLGHDHPEDGGLARATSPMWKRQEALVRRARARGLW